MWVPQLSGADQEEDQWALIRTERNQGSDTKGSARPITAKRKYGPRGPDILIFLENPEM